MAEPEDVVPVSVRLGQVIPPDDPEDWRRPLTWVAAAGMLAAPAIAAVWFWLAAPTDATRVLPGTYLVAVAVVAGGALTGVTQQGALRAFTGTLGAALFAALGVVMVGALAGDSGRSVGVAAPTVAHATVGALAGMLGALAAAAAAPAFARLPFGPRRVAVPALVGIAVASLATRILLA